MKNIIQLLPEPAKPGGNYVATKIIGSVLHISGQLPRDQNGVAVLGKVGDTVELEEAQAAARLCALNAVANIRAALDGFDRLVGIGHLNVYVASADGFNKQPLVADFASNLLQELLGSKGTHTRSAIGVAELPRGASVEIDLVAYITEI